MAQPPSLSDRRRAVEQFNSRHAVGDPFWVFRGAIGDNPVSVTLRSPAELLSGHTPVAWFDGTSGCIALTHVKVRTPVHNEADDEVEPCPICLDPFKPDDLCATDIELGTCHAPCLEGAPVVDLDTGEPTDGEVFTYRFDSLPQPKAVGQEEPQ